MSATLVSDGLTLKGHGSGRTLKGLVGVPRVCWVVTAAVMGRPFKVWPLPWSFKARPAAITITIAARTRSIQLSLPMVLNRVDYSRSEEGEG